MDIGIGSGPVMPTTLLLPYRLVKITCTQHTVSSILTKLLYSSTVGTERHARSGALPRHSVELKQVRLKQVVQYSTGTGTVLALPNAPIVTRRIVNEYVVDRV
jgi:hypothetical protein